MQTSDWTTVVCGRPWSRATCPVWSATAVGWGPEISTHCLRVCWPLAHGLLSTLALVLFLSHSLRYELTPSTCTAHSQLPCIAVSQFIPVSIFQWFGVFITCCTWAELGWDKLSLQSRRGSCMFCDLRVPLCHLCSEGGVIYTLMQPFCAGSASAQQCASHTYDGPDTHTLTGART